MSIIVTEDNRIDRLVGHQQGKKQVKFCGFTRRCDVENALSLGVDAIGLVFYPPSPRYVNAQQARQLIQGISAFTSIVALVVNITADELKELAAIVTFDVIQFHGDETAAECRVLAQNVNKRWIKALRINTETDTQESIRNTVADFEQAGASSIILDAYHKSAYGGTGERFDWSLIPHDCSLPIILAGGLNSENVEYTLDLPITGVDVSGGIESHKGIKDSIKMSDFLRMFNKRT